MPIKKPKVAVIHDWLVSHRGGEQVLESILELYPSAEIFTLFHRPGKPGSKIERHKIHSSFLNRIPGAHRFYKHLLPLFPLAIEKFDLSGFDLVISSSHCVAKGVIVPPNALHICYCHTPMRYAWDRYRDYFSGGILEPIILPFIHYLRIWDVTSSARVDEYLANSEWVKKRIYRFYRRESQVVNPYVALEKYRPIAGDKGDYYLIVSAFAPYKRIDLAIEACKKMNRKLIIVGEGQDTKKLKALSNENIRFAGRLSDSDLLDTYAGARALLFPGEEDFGIAPLEAMASGLPVIAFARGGVTETVIENETGIFFPDQTVDSLCEAIRSFEAKEKSFSAEACHRRAQEFSQEKFQREFQKAVEAAWQKHGHAAKETSLKNPVSKELPSQA